jgi:hypothetical protein
VETLRESMNRVRRAVDQMRRPPCWGPNDQGDLMVDLSVDNYEKDLNAIEGLLDRSPTPIERGAGRPSRRPASTGEPRSPQNGSSREEGL